MSPDSSGRDRELQRQLGVATPALHDLIDVFYDDYDAKNWGFSRFGSLTDGTRALVSDLVLSSADGVVVALREMGLHERAFNRLLGPNGRTMPGPETTPEEYAEMHELPMHSVGALRALGSALDCLTAVCIGVLGVQSSIHGAAASALFQPFAAPQGAAQGQVAAAQRVSDVVAAAIAEPPTGWAQWALEMRNSVVHRARLLQTWLNRPGRQPGQPRLLVRTEEPLASLVRTEPHFRSKPWLPDMDGLAAPDPAAGLWLPEPVQVTLNGLRERAVQLVDRTALALLEAWHEDVTGWVWPADSWTAPPRASARLRAAAEFPGITPDYPVPPPSFITMHPRSARRAELAERVRTESGSADDGCAGD